MDTTLSLPISKGMVDAIDQWRRLQPDLPSRSEAIRRMIQIELDKAQEAGADGR